MASIANNCYWLTAANYQTNEKRNVTGGAPVLR